MQQNEFGGGFFFRYHKKGSRNFSHTHYSAIGMKQFSGMQWVETQGSVDGAWTTEDAAYVRQLYSLKWLKKLNIYCRKELELQ